MSVYMRDYGSSIKLEYRVGPIVTCEARVLICEDSAIIDDITTLDEWKGKGHAKAVIEKLVQVTGNKVYPFAVKAESVGFWEKMQALGLAIYDTATIPD